MALRAGELPEEVLVDPPEGVTLGGRRDLRDLLEQILQERAREELVGLGQDAGELRVVLLDVPHRLVDGLPHVRAFGQLAGGDRTGPSGSGRGCPPPDTRRGHRPASRDGRRRPAVFQGGTASEEADLGEAQEDEAEDGLGVLRRGEAGVRAELVRRVPQAVFQRLGARVLLGGCDPVHPVTSLIGFPRGKRIPLSLR